MWAFGAWWCSVVSCRVLKTVLEEVLRGLVRRVDVAGGRVPGFACASKARARPKAGKAGIQKLDSRLKHSGMT